VARFKKLLKKEARKDLIKVKYLENAVEKRKKQHLDINQETGTKLKR
jgi:hypothetical protein